MNKLKNSIAATGLTVIALLWSAVVFAEIVNFAEDFSTGAIDPERFEIDTRGDESSVAVVDEIARFEAISTDGATADARLHILGETDYLEADVVLSSESDLVNEAQGRVQLTGKFYNDTQDGGFDGATGDVWAGLTLLKKTDDSFSLYACVDRADSADFGESTSLTGDDCLRFETVNIALDTDYQVSIELDRESGKVLFTFAGEVQEYIINTPIFEPADHNKSVITRIEGGSGSAIAFVDNIRTSKTAVFGEDTGTESGEDNDENNAEDDKKDSGGGGALIYMLLPLLCLTRKKRFVER